MFVDSALAARTGIRINDDDYERTPDQDAWSEHLNGSRFDIPSVQRLKMHHRLKVVLLIGQSRLHKSILLRQLTGEKISLNPLLERETLHEHGHAASIGNRPYLFIDTPSFCGSPADDLTHLCKIKDCVARLARWATIAGAIFLYDANLTVDPRDRLTLRWLQCFCGPSFFSNVVVVAGMWDFYSQNIFWAPRRGLTADRDFARILEPSVSAAPAGKGGGDAAETYTGCDLYLYHYGLQGGVGLDGIDLNAGYSTLLSGDRDEHAGRRASLASLIDRRHGQDDLVVPKLQFVQEMAEGVAWDDTQAAKVVKSAVASTRIQLRGGRARVASEGGNAASSAASSPGVTPASSPKTPKTPMQTSYLSYLSACSKTSVSAASLSSPSSSPLQGGSNIESRPTGATRTRSGSYPRGGPGQATATTATTTNTATAAAAAVAAGPIDLRLAGSPLARKYKASPEAPFVARPAGGRRVVSETAVHDMQTLRRNLDMDKIPAILETTAATQTQAPESARRIPVFRVSMINDAPQPGGAVGRDRLPGLERKYTSTPTSTPTPDVVVVMKKRQELKKDLVIRRKSAPLVKAGAEPETEVRVEAHPEVNAKVSNTDANTVLDAEVKTKAHAETTPRRPVVQRYSRSISSSQSNPQSSATSPQPSSPQAHKSALKNPPWNWPNLPQAVITPPTTPPSGVSQPLLGHQHSGPHYLTMDSTISQTGPSALAQHHPLLQSRPREPSRPQSQPQPQQKEQEHAQAQKHAEQEREPEVHKRTETDTDTDTQTESQTNTDTESEAEPGPAQDLARTSEPSAQQLTPVRPSFIRRILKLVVAPIVVARKKVAAVGSRAKQLVLWFVRFYVWCLAFWLTAFIWCLSSILSVFFAMPVELLGTVSSLAGGG